MKKILFILSVAALALVSCNKEQGTGVADGPEFIEFSIDGDLDLSVSTRASEVTTDNLANIYVTASKGQQTNSYTGVFQGATFSKNGSGSSAYWKGDQVWPSGNTNQYYHFFASNASMSGNGTSSSAVTIAVSGTTGTNSINTDIVAGSNTSASWRTRNSLTLGHIFARVNNITVNAPSGYTVSNLKVSFSPITSGTFTVWSSNSSQSNTWTNRGSASGTNYLLDSQNSGVSISTEGGSATNTSNDFWIVPANTYTLTATYTLSKGSVYSEDFSKTVQNVNFQQGLKNNITANLPAGNATDIEFSVTVSQWNENPITVNF